MLIYNILKCQNWKILIADWECWAQWWGETRLRPVQFISSSHLTDRKDQDQHGQQRPPQSPQSPQVWPLISPLSAADWQPVCCRGRSRSEHRETERSSAAEIGEMNTASPALTAQFYFSQLPSPSPHITGSSVSWSTSSAWAGLEEAEADTGAKCPAVIWGISRPCRALRWWGYAVRRLQSVSRTRGARQNLSSSGGRSVVWGPHWRLISPFTD